MRRKSKTGDAGIDRDDVSGLLDEHQLEIVDIIRTVDAMREQEDDPERKAYLDRIHEYADAYLKTFKTDRLLYEK